MTKREELDKAFEAKGLKIRAGVAIADSPKSITLAIEYNKALRELEGRKS